MKKYLLLSLALIISFIAYSQEFAPIGATWHYGYNNFATTGYVKIESVADTMINDINCRKLITNREIYDYISQSYASNYFGADFIYNDQDKVYIYRNGMFYTLYDFSADIGETWLVPQSYNTEGYCDTTGIVEVINKGDTLIGNNNLRYMNVESANLEYGWSLNGLIIENIGAVEHYFFPEQSCMIDLFEGDLFRCYEDEQLSMQIGDDACDFIVGMGHLPVQCSSNIKVSSSFHEVHFTSISGEPILHLQILDISGKEVFYDNPNKAIYSLSTLKLHTGIYLYHIEVNGRLEIGKILIN